MDFDGFWRFLAIADVSVGIFSEGIGCYLRVSHAIWLYRARLTASKALLKMLMPVLHSSSLTLVIAKDVEFVKETSGISRYLNHLKESSSQIVQRSKGQPMQRAQPTDSETAKVPSNAKVRSSKFPRSCGDLSSWQSKVG